MNRYKVKIRTESICMVEACSECEAEEKALQHVWGVSNCDSGLQSSSVTEVTNLSNPVRLVADLSCYLEQYAFNLDDGICRFCGGVLDKHAKDCVLGRARYFLNK